MSKEEVKNVCVCVCVCGGGGGGVQELSSRPIL